MKKHRFFLVQLDIGGADALDAAESTSPSDILLAVRARVAEQLGDVGAGVRGLREWGDGGGPLL